MSCPIQIFYQNTGIVWRKPWQILTWCDKAPDSVGTGQFIKVMGFAEYPVMGSEEPFMAIYAACCQ